MKKSNKSKPTNRNTSKKSPAQTSPGPQPDTRRDFLRKARNYAIGLGVIGASGLFLARSVHSTIKEHDLSRLENGIPTIVQIHDPQCSVCLSLQKQTRRAMSQFGSDELDYVVANIRSGEGRAFANLHGVPHVTLLLFDGNGELQTVLQGSRQHDELRTAFEQLVAGT